MKTHPGKCSVVLLALLVVTQAHAMRWYSPNTGRWFSRDPIEVKGGLNEFAFAENHPPISIDPLGLIIVGFYGADVSLRWPNEANQELEGLSIILEEYEAVLRPHWNRPGPSRPGRLYPSRADAQAFRDLLRALDHDGDGKYDPRCDGKEEIKIFGWSWGGTSAVQLARRIKESHRFVDKEVKLVAVIDPVTIARGNATVPENVMRFWNRYQTAGTGVYPFNFHGKRLVCSAQSGCEDQVDLNPGPDNGINHITIIFEEEYIFLELF